MNYREFNYWVYTYYLETLIPNQVNCLTIPRSEIEELQNSFDLDTTNFPEIKRHDWSYLLKNYDDDTPKFFGLVALQCHAAFIMHNDGSFTTANFRDRFIDIVGISSGIHLNSLFAEKHDDNLNVQEKIWETVQSYFKKINIYLEIPEKKSYAGRNTQFPQSQCVLNYEDLKEYYSFYKGIAKLFDIIHFEEFIKEYSKRIIQLKYNFKRINNLRKLSKSEEKIKQKQIFDHYTSNEWLKLNDLNSEKHFREVETFILKLTDNSVEIFDDNFDEVRDLNILYKSNNLILFKEDIDYKEEFNFCKKLEIGSKYVILFKNSSQAENLIEKLKLFNTVTLLNCSINGFSAFLTYFKNTIPDFLSHFEGKEYPIKLIGNKVSRKRQYFNINPPFIASKNNMQYSLYCDNMRIAESQPSAKGFYTIKVNGFSNFSFEIIDVPNILQNLPSLSNVLNLETLEFVSDCKVGMSGFSINYDSYSEDEIDNLTIKNWINANAGKKTKSNRIVIKAINQKNYGENK